MAIDLPCPLVGAVLAQVCPAEIFAERTAPRPDDAEVD
jgi:hypothetical protein